MSDSEESGSEDAMPFRWMEGDSLAPPCQSENDVIRDVLELASPTPADVVFDLGCGDGRICIEATEKYGARSCGVEIEEDLIAKFRRNVERKGLQETVRIEHGDLRDLDLSDATIIILYLLPEAIEQLQPKLLACLERGAKIVASTWGLKELQPVETRLSGPYRNVSLMLYTSQCLAQQGAGTRDETDGK